MGKTQVLLIQNYITHYNLPIYEIIGGHEGIDLTVAHFGKPGSGTTDKFREITLKVRKTGPFYLIKEDIFNICNRYDVVIAMGDIHYLSLMLLGRRVKRKFGLIYWGIGVSASYNHKLDQNRKWDFIRFFFMRGADALLFYSSYPVNKYINKGFDPETLFVADNTVKVKRTPGKERDPEIILFIGSLYKEKGINELLKAYHEAFSSDPELPGLVIIGSGQEAENIKEYIKTYNLEGKITLTGPVYDDDKLESFFLKAIAAISPGQAGLSVLKSMGYGVPFITRADSITGGERFNITNFETGIIYNNYSELVDILCNLENKKSEFRIMGEKALDFYNNYRLPEHMAAGFLKAINFVILKKRQ